MAVRCGPCLPSTPRHTRVLRRGPPRWRPVQAVVKERYLRGGGEEAAVTLNVAWGCAGWGKTQVLAEIARGGTARSTARLRCCLCARGVPMGHAALVRRR